MSHIPATVAQFLADQASEKICSACLASALGVPLQKVHHDLRGPVRESVLIHFGSPCAMCSRTSVTYSLMPNSADPAEEIVAQFFAASPAGTAVCHICLAQGLGLSYHDTQKGASRLRAAGVIRLAVGRCTHCEQPRVLVQLEERSGE